MPKIASHGKRSNRPSATIAAPAAKTFFGRLKDQMHRAVEIAGFGKVPSRTEQHRRMPVMAAGMHAPVISRAVGEVGRLLDRQAVHIGSEPNRAQRITGAQPANDTGLADAAKYLAAEPGELLGDEVGGALLFEPEFGMGMNVMPPFLQFVMEFRDAFDDLHAPLPLHIRGTVAEGAVSGNPPGKVSVQKPPSMTA